MLIPNTPVVTPVPATRPPMPEDAIAAPQSRLGSVDAKNASSEPAVSASSTYSKTPSLPTIAAEANPFTRASLPAPMRLSSSLSASTVLGFNGVFLPPSKNLSKASPPNPADITASTAAVLPFTNAALKANSCASSTCPANNPSSFNKVPIGIPAFSKRLTIF